MTKCFSIIIKNFNGIDGRDKFDFINNKFYIIMLVIMYITLFDVLIHSSMCKFWLFYELFEIPVLLAIIIFVNRYFLRHYITPGAAP